MSQDKNRRRLYLVDGSSYIFRAFYAIRPLSTSKGLPTNALYGFTRMLLKLIKDERPDKLAVVFDTIEPTFRDELFEDYKANRTEPPMDLVPQFAYFGPLVEAFNIKQIAMPGFEADDVIGTIAKKGAEDGYEVVIVTSDKDFMQLVSDNVSLFDTMKERRIDAEEVKKKFGVEPERVIDVMSLIGDSSDNIPGVRGIGDKTAAGLIRQYGSLDNLLKNADKVSNIKVRNALKEGVDSADLSRKLVTIKLDVPLKLDWDEYDVRGPDENKIKKLFGELEFFKLMREIVPEETGAPEIPDISPDDLDKIEKEIKSTGLVAIYLDLAGEDILGMNISTGKGKTAYVPFEKIDAFFNSAAPLKIYMYDAKDVVKRFIHKGLKLDGDVGDVKLMAYILNPSYPADLTTLTQHIQNIHLAADNGRILADAVFGLAKKFEKGLLENKRLQELYDNIEMPLTWILFEMEEKGIKLDTKHLEKLSKEYETKIKDIEGKIYDEAGEEFKINSPKQLSHILFEKLNIPPVKKTKTGHSTDAGVLEQLSEKYELPKIILEYRSLTKLKSTYIDALPLLVDGNNRVHTTFNQAVTATGRLSSSDPNLQNVPIRSEEGARIRAAFIAEDKKRLLSADYSQIELRILAHISEEEALIQAFKEGLDVHAATAARLFGTQETGVSKEQRAMAKTVNFGVLYGQGAYGLSKQLGISVMEADLYIKNYYKSYPRVEALKKKILKDAEEDGYVETLFGRRRYVPDIKSPNQSVKAFAERMAFNAVFQGTAADIIKMTMIEIDKILKSDFPDVSMLLQVHDELVFEISPDDIDAFTKVVGEKMCGVVKLLVPLEVNIGTGLNWAEC